MTAVWTVHTARGVAGTITDTGNGLVASPQSLQSMADVAARRGAAAYLDGYSNGYVWTEPSGHTIKAAAAGGGEGDPKAPVTGPAGQPVPPAPPTAAAWPGWAYDLTLASVYTDQVTQAFRAATTQAGHLLRDWWAGRVAATRAGLVDLISDLVGGHVGATLRRLWTEAWYLGHHSARGVAREEGPDWGTWTPGDFEAAQLVATAQGLQRLLAGHGITTIRSIAQTRMQDLADEIADAVAYGDSWEDLAARLEQILRVPQRAPMIARTEIARAVSAATMDQYTVTGVEGKEWAVAPDERVCPVCRRNADTGAIPTSSLFPSGELDPPAHPNCRCALLPAEVHGLDITGPWPRPVKSAEAEVAKSAWEHEPRGPNGEWVHVAVSDLVVHRDGSVGHKKLEGTVGSLTYDKGKWVAHHADGTSSRHGSRPAALREIVGRHNKRNPAPVPAPAPAPAARRAPGPAERTPAPPREATHYAPITGMALWMSGEGVTPGVTADEAQAARSVWYTSTFSYTNDYLRHGTLPSVSSRNAIAALHGAYGAGKLVLPTFASTDADYLKGIDTLKSMIGRAPKFSRPATMYRSVTSPDQIFGPVGSMKGRVFSDPGFMSATADPASAERYGKEDQGEIPDKIIMHIPAGGGGMRAQHMFSPDNAREKEFTFAPGTQWRVDEDEIVNGKRQTTVTQIVPPGAKPGPAPKPIVAQIRTTQYWDAFGAGHRVNVETGEYLS